MSWKEWIAVVVVIGVGIVWQIPGHDDAMPAGDPAHSHGPAQPPATGAGGDAPASPPGDVASPYRTIALEVTGMT